MATTDLGSSEKEVFSEAEVDQLLEKVAAQESQPALPPATPAPVPEPAGSQPFDFRCPAFLAPHELRAFRQQHAAIADLLSARLSNYLRLEFSLKACEVRTVPYGEFQGGLADPCHLTLFKLEPLRGICILELSTRFGLAVSDRLMGGKGASPDPVRELSQIEAVLLDQVLQLVLNEWCMHWAGFQQLTPVVLGQESSGRFLRTSPLDAIMLVVVMEVRLGETVDQLQFAFPATTVEPLLHQLRRNASLTGGDTTASATTAKPKWRREFDEVPVCLEAEWAGMRVTAGQLTRLAVGDVLPLPSDFTTRVRLCLAKAAKFSGRLGMSGERWAIEVTEVLRT